MAYVGVEISGKLPLSFDCEIYLHKNMDKIYCTCIDSNSNFGSAIDGNIVNSESEWQTLLEVLAMNIHHTFSEE